VLSTRTISERAGGTVALKAENLQRTGSFKVRGASAKLAALGEAGCAAGVVAASAGVFVNLAAAVATPGTWFSLMNYVLAATNLLPFYQQDGWKCGMVLLRGALARRSPLVEWTYTVAGGLVSVAVFVSLALRYF
jgi:Zn-dependent protease